MSLSPRSIGYLTLGASLGVVSAGVVAAREYRDPVPMLAPSASAKPVAPAVAGQYRLDGKRSRFIVEAEAGGVLSAFGHDHRIQVRDFSGTASLGSGSVLEAATLDLSVRADSLAVLDDVSPKDRAEIESTMKVKLLETAKYPRIWFKSSALNLQKAGDSSSQVRIAGSLWLHGVSRKVSIPATITLTGNNLRATGKLKLRQTDYGMTPVTAVAGTIRVKDEVTLVFDIVGTRS